MNGNQDDLGGCKGIMNGFFCSLPIYILVGLVIWKLLETW